MSDFQVVEEIRDTEMPEVLVVLTAKEFRGSVVYTFSLMKEYTTKGGENKRTAFLQVKHMSAVERLLPRVKEAIQRATKRELR